MQDILAAILIPLGAIAFVALAVVGLGTLLLQFSGQTPIWIALAFIFAILGGAVLLAYGPGSSPSRQP
ncbi:MAG: hypothetical protein HY331_17425 [Chloroflexi bacterium]|nr:hypothetical protein [Chloroflexota bacterium]